MGAKSNNVKVIDSFKSKFEVLREQQILNCLIALGNAAIYFAVNNHDFTNLTLNTEDSYSFAIYKDGIQRYLSNENDTPTAGEPIRGNWRNGTKGKYGMDIAKELLNNHKSTIKGWSMMVTTGTPYSARLEDMFNLDVLTNTFQFTKDNFFKYFQKI